MNSPKKPRPTMKDVALRAASSRSTVSRYFNDPKSISPAAAKRIQIAVEELRYRPNASARALRAGTSKLLTLLVGDLAQPFIGELAHRMNEVARDQGFELALMEHSRDPALLPGILDSLDSTISRALVVATASDLDTLPIRTSLENLQLRGVPVVTALQHLPNSQVTAITQDYVRNAQIATDHLLAQSHSRIAFVVANLTGPYTTRLISGYRISMTTAGNSDFEAVVQAGYNGQSLTKRQIFELLQQGYSAFVVSTSVQAMTLNSVLRDLGVVDSVSAVCCEWVPLLDQLRPRIPRVSIDYCDYAQQLVAAVLSEESTGDHKMVTCHFTNPQAP